MIKVCIGIFFARMFDVTLGTLRSYFAVNGKRFVAMIFAFIEVLIWYAVAREALNTTLNSIFIPISYAGGYACGTFIGTTISSKFVNGLVSVQAIIKKDSKIIESLRNEGYRMSIIPLEKDYNNDKKQMLLIETTKKGLPKLRDIIQSEDESAFLMVNETKVSYNAFIK